LIYSKEFLKNKISRIHDLYDLSDPSDFFTFLPQEMELAEVRGMINKVKGDEKKQAVMSVIMGLAKKNKVEVPKEWIEIFIDTIIKSSNGGFALNKEEK